MSTVSLARCPSYSSALPAVEELLVRLGGMGAFVRPGQKILLKVNMLSDHAPEDAVTTHPEVVRAVIRAVKAAGASVRVGDSPASAVAVAKIHDRTGIAAVCREEGAELVLFEKDTGREVERDGMRFTLSAALDGVDAVINLPKVKTHALMTLTCGVKNLYGCVPGYQKAVLHKRYPRPGEFGRLLRAILAEVRPVLTLADGVVGMEGEGPSSGTPKELGFLAASADSVALDLVVADILGIPRKSVPYLADRAKDAPEVVGEPVERLRPAQFKVPGTMRARLIPRGLVHLLSPLVWVRPGFDSSLCVRCGRCVASCPEKTLEMGDKSPYLSDPSRCIGCCCCHEMCPVKAISMRQSPLLRLYGAYKDL